MPPYTSYAHDIFLSYAHVDDAPLLGNIGWVTHLVDALEKTVAMKLGCSDCFDLWMDRRSEAHRLRVLSELKTRVESSAVFVLIASPGYLASKWCLKEWQIFRERLGLEPNGEMRRVFVIEITELPEALPNDLKDVIYHKFWRKDEDKRARTLGWPVPDEKKFFLKVQDVADDIKSQLQRLKRGRA